MNLLGYFHGVDPAACLLQEGRLTAFVEEERLIRFKHASGIFPVRSMAECLKLGGIGLGDVDAICYGWDVPLYTNGGMRAFFDEINAAGEPDAGTRAWQNGLVGFFREGAVVQRLHAALTRHFGVAPDQLPPSAFFPHHESHAAAAFFLSPADTALVLSVDGSGDRECTTLWRGQGITLTPLHQVRIPHSLGWFYAALTEFLGFAAYDGEYKVMGLAAYGRPHAGFRAKLAEVVHAGPLGWDYEVEPRFIHRGPHTFSSRFTDHLAAHLGLPPRIGEAPLESIHEDLAFETQRLLEETVLRLLRHWRAATGLDVLCIGGGVGLNVKMNSRILREGLFDTVHAFPSPNDSGTAIGAAAGIWARRTGRRPEPLAHLYLGPAFSDAEIEQQLRTSGMAYRRCDDIAHATAAILAAGKIVGWMQGGMEAGPRALGGRSILADPRAAGARDRVNAAIKFREYWRPFCPSMLVEAAPKYLDLQGAAAAPFMIFALEATDAAKREIPAVVHVDGTVRVQTVDAHANPVYRRLLEAFGRITGVPVLLNTSFNVKGEAIVCTPRDAFRTFWSTGLDALAIGSFLVEKPVTPLAVRPEDVVR